MASVGATRKLFVDSRYKVSGTDSYFTVELPVDIDCSRTSSFFLASCSFANIYQTVTPYNSAFWWLSKIPNTNVTLIYGAVIPLGSYQPAALGTALAGLLNTAGSEFQNVVFAYNGDGTYTVTYTSFAGATLIVPNYAEIDKYGSTAIPNPGGAFPLTWTPGSKYQSVNTLLNTPLKYLSTSYFASGFKTGIIDLTPLREVYLHSSLANNKTLHVNGARDCIARVPIDVDFGQIVTYRHLGPTDAISSVDLHFRTIAFQLRDWAGNIVPTGSFVVIELCFLDNDPYAM
jgi:hypothetical protein